SLRIGYPAGGETPGGTAQVFDHEHEALVRQKTFDGLPAEGQKPADQVESIDLALMIRTDLLQVVEQPCFDRPKSYRRRDEQSRQHFLPGVRIGVVQVERLVQAAGELV